MEVEETHINEISSEETSVNEDDENTLSDSDLKNLKHQNELTQQLPSKNEIEKEQINGQNPTEDEWTDILGNGDLMKKIIRKGNSDVRPETGELVKIVWKDLSSEGQEEIQFILGYGFYAEAFDLAVKLMYVGEISHITSSSRFVDNSDSNGKDFYDYEIELVDVQPAENVDLNIRVNEAREFGNIYFNKGKYEKSYRLYEYGLKLLSSEDSDEIADDLELRKYTLISNSAACLLKIKEWKKVVEITDNLPLNQNIDKLILTKLTLRRSDAFMQLKKYDEAMNSLKDCLAIDPSNTRAKSLLEQTKNLSAKEEKRMDKLYKNMFKALGTDEPTGGMISKVKSFMLSRNILLVTLFVGFLAILIHLVRLYI